MISLKIFFPFIIWTIQVSPASTLYFNIVRTLFTIGQMTSFKPIPRSSHTILRLDSNNDRSTEQNNSSSAKVVRSRFDRVVDDFIGKRFGAGEAFYGRRVSDLTDTEFDELQKINEGSSSNKRPRTLEEYSRIDQDFKDNSVLLVGRIDSRTNIEVLQWIAYDLLEKGFSVRIATVGVDNESGKALLAAIRTFGLPGVNVDLLELISNASEERYEKALEGVQAVILCDKISPTIGSRGSESPSVTRLLDLCRRQREAGLGQIQKIVMVSRYLPHLDGTASSNPLQFVEALVSEALSPAAALLSLTPPLLPAHYQVFAPWRRHHEQLEALVRRTGCEYVVVRAPCEVQACRPGARETMRAFSAAQLRAQSVASLSIGALDLAECVVQSLLLERVSGVSFTVCAAPPAAPVSPSSSERAGRDTYYSILSLDDTADPQQLDINVLASGQQQQPQGLQEVVAFDEGRAQEIYSEMRSTYIIRPVEAYRSQVEEDGQVEQFWSQLLAPLDRDPASML